MTRNAGGVVRLSGLPGLSPCLGRNKYRHLAGARSFEAKLAPQSGRRMRRTNESSYRGRRSEFDRRGIVEGTGDATRSELISPFGRNR